MYLPGLNILPPQSRTSSSTFLTLIEIFVLIFPVKECRPSTTFFFNTRTSIVKRKCVSQRQSVTAAVRRTVYSQSFQFRSTIRPDAGAHLYFNSYRNSFSMTHSITLCIYTGKLEDFWAWAEEGNVTYQRKEDGVVKFQC